jgi:glycosyltransferase involved in cell wall biosynthesis
MRIWLVQVGEELPIDPGPPRMWRTCLLAQELVARGHEVTYWSGSFNHQQKIQRTNTDSVVAGPGYSFQMLNGRAYSSNISIGRILSQIENARAFDRVVSQHSRPDVIHCGFPLIELAAKVANFAVQNKIPYTLDGRDMWPEIFQEHIPPAVHPFIWPVIKTWERMRRRTFQRAAAITGISDAFVDWGLRIAGRPISPLDRSFHLAISATSVSESTLAVARDYWSAKLGPVDPSKLTICFAGTMSTRMDFETVLNAVIALPEELRDRVNVVFCGEGDARAGLLEKAKPYRNIHVPGWQDAAQLRALMLRSDVGLLPYPNSGDFQASYPNKVGEYLASGLPIITGLRGITHALLDREDVLLPYTYGNEESLTAGLIKWIDGLSALREKKQNARAVFSAYFNPERIYPDFADWIETVGKRSGNVV